MNKGKPVKSGGCSLDKGCNTKQVANMWEKGAEENRFFWLEEREQRKASGPDIDQGAQEKGVGPGLDKGE